jgi:hypothetical protein
MTPEELRDRILAFIEACRLHRPVIREESETMPLEPERFSVEVRQGKVLLEAWDDSRSLVRRVVEIRKETEHELVLGYRRFGAGQGAVRIVASAKLAPELRREAARSRFADRLRKMLAQQFPGWKVEHLSAQRDLEHAFSADTVRAVLRRGQTAWAVAACAEQEGEEAADGALTQGLAWLEHLRRSPSHVRSRRLLTGLKLFLPEQYVAGTALRRRFLNREPAQYELFAFSPDDEVRRAEELDYANLATELPLVGSRFPVFGGLLSQLAKRPAVELVQTTSGPACRIRGLQFAHLTPDGPVFGFGQKWRPLTPETLSEAEALAVHIAEVRSAGSSKRHDPLYTAQPERWLESLLAADISALSAELDPAHVYSQVPAMIGGHRGIIDLLAATRAGRLVVIELKASSDPNLPMQALDYWMRVKWHFERGDFRRCGYFPGVELRPEAPLLWLVAPAYAFHPHNELVLRYLSPEVPIRRIGLNESWREGVQVVYHG